MSEKDKAPEFSAQTLPAGTAPPENTFKPNPIFETPGQADNEDTLQSDDKESTNTSALDTLGGVTSGDVHKGLGHPGSGQTSSELRNEGQSTSKRDRTGLDGMASGGSGMRDDGSHASRALETDKAGSGPVTGHDATGDASIEGAEAQVPVTADEVAAERD